MKRIKYMLANGIYVGLAYSEKHLEIAKKEAYNGEYEFFDDGEPEPVAEPTTDDVLNAMLGVM